MNNRARTQKKNFTPTTAGAQPQSFLCRTIETGEYVIVHRSSIKRTYDDAAEIVMNGTHDECRRVWEKKNKISNLDDDSDDKEDGETPVEILTTSFNNFGFTIIILASFLFENTLAEYDCSAKDDGWYYDPEFCHIYWRCIHGASEEFECASGTAWDHHENRCNWLDSVDCSRAEKTTAKPVADYDDVQEVEEENNHNHNNDDDDEPPIVVVKKTKKKKKKQRKIETKLRKLDADENEGKDYEIYFVS
ncbi:unnamed protein product [Rotaria magnacalcarata]|uniref:Chitin-binding type-2 domain-containing protein n=1 Tax=Rotaria magnacalcarata TaxID=392030 RepID=A0A819VV70_9BILA|nr:unnamed protein product [Rotaria magnacalcarata]CAF4114416.1 unnamed protein product [Rotaria magnacalcarata]